MQRGPLVMHSHRIESAKKLTHYHRRSSCLQEKQGTSLPGSRPLSSGISLARRRQRTFCTNCCRTGGIYKLCPSHSGNISSIEVLSRIPGADRAIVQMPKSWRYRPQSKPVCFVRSFDFEVEGDTAYLSSDDYHPVPAELVAAAPIHDASACAAVIRGTADGRVGKVAFRIELDAQGKIHKLSALQSHSLALNLYVASLLRYNPKCRMKPAVDKAGKPVPFVLERYQISLE